jgi:hypothetical protein
MTNGNQKESSNLKLVEAASSENERPDEGKRCEKAEKDLLITPSEAKHRVQVLREDYKPTAIS